MIKNAEMGKEFLQPRSHRFYNLAILFTGALIFIFVPMFFLTPEQSKKYLNNGREFQVLIDVAILVAGYYVLMGTYYWVLTAIKLKEIAATHVMFVFCWVALSGFLFPMTTASGMFDIHLAPTHMLNFKIVLVLSAIFAVLSVSRFSSIVQVFLAIFLTASILPTLPRVFSKFEKTDVNANAVELSSEKNILLIGLDGLPGNVVEEVLRSSPSLAHKFKDFTFYKNVTASSPATDASLQGIVYGNHDFTKYETPDWKHWRDLYFNRNGDINFTTGYKYNKYNLNGTKLAAGKYGVAEQRNELFELYHYTMIRLTGSYGATQMHWVDESLFPDRKGKFYLTVEGFDRVMDSIVVKNHKSSVFYTHFTFTHWPLQIDEDCNYRRTDESWFSDHQNIKGLKAGVACGLSKYVELINKLKELEVYDNSTIVLLSDHGTYWGYYDTSPHNLIINNGPTLGFNRYKPFLMIKAQDQTSDDVTFSDKYAVLDDVAQTTCNVFEPAEFCDDMPGLNLLDDKDIAPEHYYIHVVKDKNSKWAVSDHKAVNIPRNAPLLETMMESKEVQLTDPR